METPLRRGLFVANLRAPRDLPDVDVLVYEPNGAPGTQTLAVIYSRDTADGGDAPDKRMELVPGAVSEAQACLKSDRETQSRFERVSRLVEGSASGDEGADG
jgi:hypothetical protein